MVKKKELLEMHHYIIEPKTFLRAGSHTYIAVRLEDLE
jgi:hypothetical protein